MDAGAEARTRRSHSRLVSGVERSRELSSNPARLAVSDPAVSGWSVGQHVEHLWLAADGILGWVKRALDDPAASPPGGTPSPTGSMVLVSGWIPRGKAKAPEMTVPGPTEADDITARLVTLIDFMTGLEPRLEEIHRSRCTREHPILGHFTPAQWVRFLDIHQRHHEKIIRDIAS